MDKTNTSLLLKRPITLKIIVTTTWKQEAQQQLQSQITQLDDQMQQIEIQGQRAVTEIQKQSISPPGPAITEQIDNIRLQVNEKKSEMLESKNQFLQQMQQIQLLELDQEVVQGQMESFFRLEKGDNLLKKLNVEIVVRDGVVQEIRGDI
ncbi:YlqD family protein [Cyanobacterium sp. uoEpiScrs1]|uniref:YlqD family protein n=1 Tax=Cyanobacterium sp. uoEpiScrs1 TaxID=2976343 RepID=UPI00226A4A40|nr:YlqD family protein [Cyanobacterium sp. uoEpiScrs1]